MSKHIYHIEGFDCANCASKVEAHFNKHPKIEKAVLDFLGEKLIINYKEEELEIDDLLAIASEVEDDEISISEADEHHHEHHSLFDLEMVITFVRIVIASIIMVLGLTLFKDGNLYWVSFSLHLFALLLIGYDIYYKVIFHIIHWKNIIDEHLLMALASIGAFLVASITYSGDFFDAVMVLVLFQIGEIIEDFATNKSKKSISDAFSLRVEIAHQKREEGIIDVKPEDLHIGDIVVVTKGESVPIDGVIIEGNALADTSSLTGEFVPISIEKDSEVYSGYIIKEGSVTLRATKEYKDSAVSKIIDLISNSTSKKSKADHFVTKFARIYTPIIFGISLLTFIIGGAISSEWANWSILGLKLLVVGCPCAIVISVPLAYFASIGLASKKGIVVKGANYLDKINEMNVVVTDKTGTLTKGEFAISDVHAIGNKEELLECLYAAECLSTHPIGRAVIKDVDTHEISKNVKDYQESTGKGVTISYKRDKVYAGNAKLLKEANINFEEVSKAGVVIYVAKNTQYLGYVVLSDELKQESQEAIKYFKDHNIDTVILSGDKQENVQDIAYNLGIDRAYGELLPEEKIAHLEDEMNKGKVVAYLGDGVNDAACIKEADIGFAMGAIGSDIAVENADIVIMTDNPYKVVETKKIAKLARKTAIFNIVFALVIKIGIEVAALVCSLLGHPEIIPMWAAVLTDTGLSVVLIINSLLVLYRKIK